MRRWIARNKDFFLDELADALHDYIGGARPDDSTVWRMLELEGITHKKVSHFARERRESLRLLFTIDVGKYDADQLVFADETRSDRRSIYR